MYPDTRVCKNSAYTKKNAYSTIDQLSYVIDMTTE